MMEFSWLPSGRTRLVAIVGDPVAQVKAPQALTAHLRRQGLDAVVIPLAVRPADLSVLLDGLSRVANLAGVIATVPHKPAALAAAVTCTDRAARTGAANVLRPRVDGGWEADMLDGLGFLDGLRQGGIDPAGRRAIVVGAGGVGSAIAVCLAEAGASVAVHDVDPDRAMALAARIPGGRALSAADPAGFTLAVNATPLGMRGADPLPFDVSRLPAGAAVAEVVMEPAETALLRAASGRGLQVFPGRLVMEFQLPRMTEFFFENGSPRQA